MLRSSRLRQFEGNAVRHSYQFGRRVNLSEWADVADTRCTNMGARLTPLGGDGNDITRARLCWGESRIPVGPSHMKTDSPRALP